MSETISEHLLVQLSAYMDGELDAEESAAFVDVLRRNPALKARWERYHLGGDAIRGQLPQQLQPGFADRIAAALEHEPTVFAPAADRVKTAVAEPVEDQALNRNWRQSAFGLAVAASVAAVGVLGLNGLMQPQDNGFGQSQIVASRGEPIRWQDVEEAKVRERLDHYLVNHHGASRRVTGMLPYVNVVGFSPDAR